MIVLPSNAMFHDTEPGELKNFAVSRSSSWEWSVRRPPPQQGTLCLIWKPRARRKNVIISADKKQVSFLNTYANYEKLKEGCAA